MCRLITEEMAETIIENWCNDIPVPYGNWYCTDGDRWVGIFNESGDCWVEDFATKKECIAWLTE